MDTVFDDNKVNIGPEFVPRVQPGPGNLIVTGDMVIPDGTFNGIEVRPGAVFRADRSRALKLSYVTLIIMPGGTLDIGTEQDPMLMPVELIGRNVPIDFTKDPFQWGNGIVNFGMQSRVGKKKTHCRELAAGLVAGQTMISLSSIPVGWDVGDELQIPDTEWPLNGQQQPRVESPVFIAAISGTVLTLSKGLDFDHPPLTDPDGYVWLFPCVCNLSRNIVVKSEDASGVATHNVDTGMNAMSDVRFNRIVACGRTTAEPLDNTSSDRTHIGTNQVGKYADHFHHAHGIHCHREGNVLDGRGGVCKWGMVVHGTHDAHVDHCVSTFFPGACFITEDGPETRDAFHHCVATYSLGGENIDHPQAMMQQNRPGVEGTGFWLHGVRIFLEENEAWNCRVGWNLFNQQQKFYNYPSIPGGEHDTPFNGAAQRAAVPLMMADNFAVCNQMGMDLWATDRFPCVNFWAAGNGTAIHPSNSENIHLLLTGVLRILGKNGAGHGIAASAGYVSSVEVDAEVGPSAIVGCEAGFLEGGGIAFTKIKGLRMQNVVDYDFSRMHFRLDIADSLNVPLPGRVPQFLITRNEPAWDPTTTPTPDRFWLPNTGTRVNLANWQRSGQDYRLFTERQLDTAPAPPSSQVYNSNREFHCPEDGINQFECWERYRLSPGGEAARRADTIELEGVIHSRALPGIDSPLGPPSAVLASPSMREPAILGDNFGTPATTLNMALIGDPSGVDDVLAYSVDGGPTEFASQSEYQSFNARRVNTDKVSPGTHTVEMWRREAGTGNEKPGSRRSFQFFVGEPGDVPPPPPPPPVDPPVDPPPTDGLAAPIIDGPLMAGATVVSGNGSTNGAVVRVKVDGATFEEQTGSFNGSWSVPVPALVAGQQVTASQERAGAVSPSSSPLTVQGDVVPQPPVPPTVLGPLAAGALEVKGTGLPGAVVQLLIDGMEAQQGTVEATGAFTIAVAPLVAGQAVSAVQTLAGLTSDSAEPVTVHAVTPPNEVLDLVAHVFRSRTTGKLTLVDLT